MTKILKIAKLELSVLFYSPIAWLVLTIFMVQCGIGLFANLANLEINLASGYNAYAITRDIFTSNYSGLLSNVQANLYLYLPILTMGLMSRETSSGSIKLLLSSPVKLTEIILGKYLAIITYGLFLVGVLLVYVIVVIVSVQHADIGLMMSGLLGIYLLICTYAAIGLFMSCLTNYQVVAAISTLAVFATLKYVGTMGQDIDFIRDLTYFLSLSGRVENMINGLVITRDIFYYLIIIVTFLSLCVLLLKGQRELKPWPVKGLRYTLLIVVALMLGYLTSRPYFTGYLDASADQAYTISKNGQQVARQFKGRLDVTTYVNLLAASLDVLKPEGRNKDLANLDRYKRFIPGMEFHYVYYYAKPEDSLFSNYRFNPILKGVTDIDSIGEVTANSMAMDWHTFISPAAVAKKIDLGPEGYAQVRHLQYEGKSTFLRFFRDLSPYASEKEVMAALKRLLRKAPKVVFISANNARNTVGNGDREYLLVTTKKTERGALVNQGFDVDTVDLIRQEIPANTDILVLPDPLQELTDAEKQRLSAYLEAGGNMLVLGDPASSEVLNPFLTSLGIRLKSGMLMTGNKDESPGFINAKISPAVRGLDTTLNQLLGREATVAMQGAASIETLPGTSFTVTPFLTYDKDSVMVALTRDIHQRQQRIIISGDADFISNGELHREPPRGSNEGMMQGLFGWLSYEAFPFNPDTLEPADNTLKVKRAEINMLGLVCKGLIPAIIVLIGAVLLLKRKRK